MKGENENKMKREKEQEEKVFPKEKGRVINSPM